MHIRKSEKANALGCRNGGIKILVFLILTPVIILLIAFVILWLPIPGIASDPGSKGRNVVAAITVGIIGFGIIVTLIVYLRKVLITASHCMDEYFQKNGMVVSNAYAYGRTFSGIMGGVQIDGILLPSYYLQPWRLYVTMKKSIGYFGIISNRKSVLNRFCKYYHQEGSLSSYFTVSTESQRMNKFLSNPIVEKTIHKMVKGHSKQDTWDLSFYKNRIEFNSRQYYFRPKEKEKSLDSFFSLVQKIPVN